MKIKNIIFIILLTISLGLFGYCKKENKPENLQELEKSAQQLCDKLISCVLEPMKNQPMPMNFEIDTFKKQCEKNVVKALQKETQIQQFKSCLDALANATCEQIQKNQIEACTSINQLILSQP